MVQCLACAEESLTHQASLLVSPAPRCNSQSVFEVLGHIVVGHDVVQHSAVKIASVKIVNFSQM